MSAKRLTLKPVPQYKNAFKAALTGAFGLSILAWLGEAPAQANIVNVDGRNYSIKTILTGFNNSKTLLTTTPWFNNQASAFNYANAWRNAGFFTGADTGFSYSDLSAQNETANVDFWGVSRSFYGNQNSYTYAYALDPINKPGNVASGNGNNKTSNLDITLSPAFQGGSLTVDQAGAAIALPFSVSDSSDNYILPNGNDATFSGAFSDESTSKPGRLEISGLRKDRKATITLSGSNTFSGEFRITSAEAKVTGSLSDAVTVIVKTNGTYRVAATDTIGNLRAPDTTSQIILEAGTILTYGQAALKSSEPNRIAGTISGSGGLTKVGPYLSELSENNTYTGPTVIDSGILRIKKNHASPTTVNPNGTLESTGTISANVVNAGNVSPGSTEFSQSRINPQYTQTCVNNPPQCVFILVPNSGTIVNAQKDKIATLTVDGDYTQLSGGTLNIDVDGSTSDLLQITGSGRVTDLSGTVLIAGQPTPGKVYTGITAPTPYTGSSTANADTSSAVVALGMQFVRGQTAEFNQLAGSPTYDPTKLQFGWIQNAPNGSSLPVNTAPGQATINAAKQTGGAITATITQPPAQTAAQCTANTGNTAACNNVINGGGSSGSSKPNANNVQKAKAIDAGMTSVFSAVNSGVTGGEPIPSSSGAPTGYTTNQAAAALVTPDFVTVYSALLTLPTVGQVNQALHAISAEPYASMQSVALEAMEQFRSNTLALSSGSKAIPFIAEEQVCQVEPGTNTDPNQAPPADCKPRTVQKLTPWSLLIDATNTQASLNGTNDLASLDYNIFSSSYGLQYDFNRQWSAGAAFGYGRANLYNYEYANVRIDSSTYAGSVWGTYRPSAAWKLTALAGYMNFQYDSDRTINFGGLNRTANASWSGNGFTTALAAEYEWVLANDKTSRSAVRIKPNTFLSYAIHNQGSFSESGAGALNLAVDSHTADSLLYGIGFQIETPIITGKTSRLIPRLSLGYEYDFNGDSNEEHQLTASFAEVPALGSVDVLGQNRGSNALDVGLSLEYETSEKLSLYAGVGGAFWSNGNELSYGGGMRLRW